MKTVSTKQSGFVGMHTLLAVVVVVLIVAIGWFVWNNKEDSKTGSKKDTAKTETTQSCKDTDLSQFCIERAPAEKTKFSKLPAELQATVKATFSEQVPVCIQDGQIVDNNGNAVDLDVEYAPVGSAIVGIGCDGASAGLFAKDLKIGAWKFVEKTQMAFTCDSVFSNPVPKALLSFGREAECLDGNTTKKYDAASAERFM
jgi:hypothetical protein